MPNQAPGAYVTVTAAPPSPNAVVATGVWFVTGQTFQGPTNVAIPITSISDYLNYLGPRVSYGSLYDSLDEFFHDGGVQAYVSRLVGPGAAAASVVLQDRNVSPASTLTVSAAGGGSWGNALQVAVANGTVSNSYTLSIVQSGTTILTSPNLFSPTDAVTWFGAQNSWQSLVTVTNNGSPSSAPSNNPATGTFSLTAGSDDTANVTETQWTNALANFTDSYGPGQVSAPGHTTSAGYTALMTHAVNYNRIALLDVADNGSATSLQAQAAAVQTSAPDPSYGAMFGPWIIVPGLNSANPGSASPVPNRVVPPSSLAAAMMASNDQTNDANRAAAGPNGVSSYAIGVTHFYIASDRGNLNAAGVNIIRDLPGVNNISLYGYQSLAIDPNWVQLGWARMRMQMINDFGNIAEGFVFGEIDGKGQLFAQLNGALAGQCQQYWINNSIYGKNPQDAFAVNTGPQVNTTATIAAGQVNAQVLVRLSPTANVVTINVIKYLTSVNLPFSA